MLMKASELESADYESRLLKVKQVGMDNGIPHWYGEVPVTPQLQEFMQGLEKAMPNIKFKPSSKLSANGYIRKFYAVMDNCPFVLGHVGYADVSVYKNAGNSFYVYSRKIQNGKYGSHRPQFHTKVCKDIPKAIKQAKANLVPYTNGEMIDVMYGDVRSKALDHITLKSERVQYINHKYTGRSAINTDFIEELRNLKAQGVKFATNYFDFAMQNIDEAYAQWEENKNYQQSMTYVRIEKGEYPVAHVCRSNTHIKGDARFYVDYTQENYPVITYPLDQLPEDIAGGVAVLSILNDEQYAERVGYKSDSNIFWIERDKRDDK